MPKISELNPIASVSLDDLIPVVNDPSGVPSNNKITFNNFANSIVGYFGSKGVFDNITVNTGNVVFDDTTITTKHISQDLRIDPQGGNVYIGTDKNLIFDINAFNQKGIIIIDSTEDGYDDPTIPSVLNVGSIYHDTGTMVISSDGSITETANTANTIDAYGELLLTNKDYSSFVKIGFPENVISFLPESTVSKTIVYGNRGITLSSNNEVNQKDWFFDDSGVLNIPDDIGDIHRNGVSVLGTGQIDGGNAFTTPTAEITVDGGGA